MLDTLILIVGLLCAGVITLLCSIEYSPLPQRSALAMSIHRILERGPNLHSMILALVVCGALASSYFSARLNQGPVLAEAQQPAPP